jgi:hypothetical protein
MFYIENRITNDLRISIAENNHVPIKHKQMSLVSNGGKFKLYTLPNGLFFSTPTLPRISFERMIPTTATKLIIVQDFV